MNITRNIIAASTIALAGLGMSAGQAHAAPDEVSVTFEENCDWGDPAAMITVRSIHQTEVTIQWHDHVPSNYMVERETNAYFRYLGNHQWHHFNVVVEWDGSALTGAPGRYEVSESVYVNCVAELDPDLGVDPIEDDAVIDPGTVDDAPLEDDDVTVPTLPKIEPRYEVPTPPLTAKPKFPVFPTYPTFKK